MAKAWCKHYHGMHRKETCEANVRFDSLPKHGTSEIRETNLAGQLFLRSQGFRAVSVLRDYYDDITEDAYVMLYRVNSNQGAIL